MVLYDKGARVWAPDKSQVWVCGEIKENKGDSLVITSADDGKELTVKVKDACLRNPDILEAVDDLTTLSYLHEPAVLHTLRTRYDMTNIYTYCGIVLVAINPFQKLDIYNNEIIKQYRGKQMGELEPHLFALAEEAFNNMAMDGGRNQSIVVSGESGAGKTVSAKFCMRYFATVGGNGESSGEIEQKVLASNPVMESFGNAKTTRNNNSSRFGKYITIQFEDKNHAICGAATKTYLLEKSRVVFQADEERGYHIFYQLCASAYEQCSPDLEPLGLLQSQKFHYLNKGNSPNIDGVDDVTEFEETRKSLKMVLGCSNEQLHEIFSLLAAILHLGNIEIHKTSNRNDNAKIDDADPHLQHASRLLQVDMKLFTKWLTKRNVKAARETILKTVTDQEASDSRDAFAKHLYAVLFNWIVLKVNNTLEHKGFSGKFIGVLDIYGFEVFEINSFEQFCINYANEKLQQQFNQHVFKLEQEEYVKEEIEWSFINFYDNQPCIDLIEIKMGVLSLLDEEARMVKGSNTSFLNKLKTNHNDKEHFEVPRIGGESRFTIKHFAAPVTYLVDGFLEKNRDSVREELVELLSTSGSELLQTLFGEEKPTLSQSNSLRKHEVKRVDSHGPKSKATVGSQFKGSLQDLMTIITSTQPHYCRCLKPNDEKKPFLFNTHNMVEQLRACGVLETIRISAAGFPSRWEYNEFVERYSLLCNSKDFTTDEIRSSSAIILDKVIGDKEKYQCGKTKVFFRAGQVAYMERLRSNRIKESISIMQRTVRSYLGALSYKRMKKAASIISKVVRAFLARKEVQAIREDRAALKMQSQFRGWRNRNRYHKAIKSIIGIQSLARKIFAIQEYQSLLKEKSAVVVQSKYRMFVAKKEFQRDIQRIVCLQNVYRCRQAKKELRELKTAAKDVNNLKEKNWGLENKIMAMQRQLDEKNSQLNSLKSNVIDEKSLLKKAEQKWEVEVERLMVQIESLTIESAQKDELLLEKEADYLTEIQKYQTLEKEKDSQIESNIREIKELKETKEDMIIQLNALDNHLKGNNAKRPSQARRVMSPISLSPPPYSRHQSHENLSNSHSNLTRHASMEAAKGHGLGSNPAQLTRNASVDSSGMRSPTFFRNSTFASGLSSSSKRSMSSDHDAGNAKVLSALQEQLTTAQSEVEQSNREKESLLERISLLSADHAEDELQLQVADLMEEKSMLSTLLEDERKEKSALLKELASFKNSRKKSADDSTESETINLLKEEIIRITQEFEQQAAHIYELESLLDNREMDEDFERRVQNPRRAASISNKMYPHQMPVASDDIEEERLYLFKFDEADESKIINELIVTADYKRLAQEPEGTVAHILFMCIRYCDYQNKSHLLQSVLTNAISSIKHVIMKKNLDLGLLSFWFTNSTILLNDMYLSECEGENEYELDNFDLSEYRQVLEDLAVQMYIAMVRSLQNTLKDMVVECVLDYENLQGMMSTGLKKKNLVRQKDKAPLNITDILTVLTNMHNLLSIYKVPKKIILQLYVQIAFFISATALNILLLRKDLCHWSKGLQINYNLAQLEQWFRDYKLDEAMFSLATISQATKLLQMSKGEKDDCEAILTTCRNLNYLQIQKILKLYTADTFEEKVPPSLIREIEIRGKSSGQVSLMIDVDHIHPIEIPYDHLDEDYNGVVPDLSKVKVPPFLKLEFLERM